MFEIKTSAKNLISSLRHSPEWRMASYGFSHGVGKTGKVRAEPRKECKTATFVKRGGAMVNARLLDSTQAEAR